MEIGTLSVEMLDAIDMVINGFEGALVIDKKGRIVVYTDRYAEVAGIPKEDAIGKYVLDVWPDSRMMEVINTGKPIYIDLWDAGKETVFVSRYPITTSKDGIIGAVAVCVFRYLDEAQGFAEHVRQKGQELEYYKTQLRKISGAKYSIDAIIGTSRAITFAKQTALSMSKVRSPVLILGETGTGKELFAHAIHQASPRRDRPFIRVNCASIPENLVESELFGYEEGAFSGAKKGGKPGKFELAHGGTIFLDEINELPYHVQSKLLRVLQEGEIDRVGGTDLTYVDIRIISASNANLRHLVDKKLFREDLYYRINAFQLKVPPLRERLEDIPLLCEYFLNYCAQELGVCVDKTDPKVLQIFTSYNWPGNVRELRNVMQRACIMGGSGTIKVHHLEPEFAKRVENVIPSTADNLEDFLNQAEREHILKALQSVRWNRNKAAEILQINRTQLYRKMKKHELLNE